MSLDRRALAGAVALTLSLALGACGAATPTVTPAATVVADRTPGPDAAPELAAMLPSSAGGLDFVRSSVTGPDVRSLGVALDSAELERLAKAQGKSLADVQVAEARPADPSKSGILLAIRVPGADPKDVVEATFSASAALQLATMGGKSVYKVGASGLNVVVYPKDDILFQVVGAPADLTEAIIAALP
ncbi:MAG TPA: hypothetical protein VGK16_03260 [Candidatus Limnocylindrales bacterium]|jgi:hypothetical protein